MKYNKHYLLSAINIIFILLICSMAYGEVQSSANYSMRQCTLNNAGGQSSSDNYALSHILAQPSPVTSSSSSGYRLYGGFRHSTRAVTDKPDGDVAPLGNRDGTVNVGDALVALRFALLLETPTQEDIQHGDVAPLDAGGQPNPDGQITVGDALVILRKALGLSTFEEFQLEGRILFGNKAITEYTSNHVTFWFRDETTGTSIDNVFTIYDNQTGKYGVSGLPNGPFLMYPSIHETGEAVTFPGNFKAWITTVDLSTLSDAEAASYDLQISKIIHLTKPFDNSGYTSWPPPYPQYDSPLFFQWEAITGATRYNICITKYGDSLNSFMEYVIQQSTTSTSIECTLTSSGDQTHYHFSVRAYNAGNDMVGYYYTTCHPGGGYGAHYKFKIK